MSDLRTAIQQISKADAELGDLDDRLSAQIDDLEQALAVHVTTKLSQTIRLGETTATLNFGKPYGRWGLSVVWPEGKEVRAHDLSRRDRTRLFVDGHIEALLGGALEALHHQRAEREAAIKIAEGLIMALNEA